MTDRAATRALYREFARVGNAFGNETRLMLIDLLAQSPRHVDALASEISLPMASISQHLQILRNAKLVEADREGTKSVYRLADDRVAHLWLTLRAVARRRLPEVSQILSEQEPLPGISQEELANLLESGEVYLIDVRPRLEYAYGHLPDAVSMPLEELPQRLDELPRDRLIVAYCRGVYCWLSDDAVAFLRQEGFNVACLEGGWPEWRDEGRDAAASSL